MSRDVNLKAVEKRVPRGIAFASVILALKPE